MAISEAVMAVAEVEAEYEIKEKLLNPFCS